MPAVGAARGASLRLVALALIVLAVPASLFIRRALSGDDARDPITAGRPAPEFVLPAVDGPALASSELKGKPAVISFWGAWCEDCLVALDRLVDARTRHPELALAGILFRERPEKGLAAAAAAGVDWPQLIDPGEEVAAAYGVEGAPITFFVDRSGTIAGHLVGPITDRLVERQLTRIL